MLRLPLILMSLLLLLAPARAQRPPEPWMERLGSIPIQDGGRVMPLDTYARNLAAQLTGRASWSADRGPEAFAGRHHLHLLCDLLFRPMDVIHKPLLAIENRPFKQHVGLDAERRFFSATEIANHEGIQKVLQTFEAAKAADSGAQPNRDQRQALDLQAALAHLSSFLDAEPLAIVPVTGKPTFLRAGPSRGDPSTEGVVSAFGALGQAYTSGQPLDAAVESLIQAIGAVGAPDATAARSVRLETLYNHHRPWRMATYAYALSLILFGISRLAWRKALVIAALVAAAWGVGEHLFGLSLRIAILGRAPVSNTYEALIWMGLIAILAGLVGQIVNRKAWYLFAGIAVAELSVLFSALVPLESRTNALPAVLRSNYWLIIHVLTIVASYGVLAVASLLGHVYLVKEVLLKRRVGAEPAPSRLSHPLVVQLYRAIQIGLILLTAGTILGGVWAADSWGRFWGWDPKETWALISIIVYFAVLHARYVRWLEDFGLAAAAVVCFAVIVWTFYGVNYLMASGLHSYGFGSGGGGWVAAWAAFEIAFIGVCKIRHRALDPKAASPMPAQSSQTPAPSAPSLNPTG